MYRLKLAPACCGDVPYRRFERGFGHVVSAHAGEARRRLARVADRRAEQLRNEETGDDVPGGGDRLV